MAKQRKAKVWHKVTAPKPWRAKPGEEIIGTYIGTEIKLGSFGEYFVHIIKVDRSLKSISGTVLNDLFSLIKAGTIVKVKFNGIKPCMNSDREYKDYDVFTEEEISFRVVGKAV